MLVEQDAIFKKTKIFITLIYNSYTTTPSSKKETTYMQRILMQLCKGF